ncbi:hypothetical protein HBZC1_03770 [Helicobacter bizzozeronii CIII-1]|uniref:Uncharacterized protein n=1 Tax=Helicobacter bizzozeronii (strain CIII-1) TaxID=1002804 RepID=F8KRH8_HELBC|nr:hypothetical protein [Helicobacter bizzozeronii]CCB79363.1 hypothetical protein HBZC1_03770 [Helicobacter bizzozeronii CIII-1]
MPDNPGVGTPQDLELLLAKIEASQAQFKQEINSKIESLRSQHLDLNSVFRVERKNTAIAYKLVALLAFCVSESSHRPCGAPPP